MLRAISSTFIALTCFVFSTLSQDSTLSDSIVRFSELSYSSTFERDNTRSHFHETTTNYLPFFLGVDADITTQQYELNQTKVKGKIAQIKKSGIQKKPDAKKIKLIYKSIHDDFFTKYELQNQFGEVFTTGQFNCVSATAIFGMVFEELGIPYSIKETPTHVYLVAYPKSSRIMVETTAPQKGYYQFDQAFKVSYISYLRDNKLISEEEFSNKSSDQLFDENYFSETDITMRQLVGIQYMNDAVYKIEDEKYKEAHSQLEKAYMYYPSEKAAYLLVFCLSYIIESEDYSKLENLEYLVKGSRLKHYGITNEHITSEFLRITDIHLIQKNDVDYYDQIYQYLIENLDDDSLTNEISYIYHYERGRISYNKGLIKYAIEHASEAYSLKPTNADIEALLVACIGQGLKRMGNMEAIRDSLVRYEAQHPNLKENGNFTSMIINVTLTLSAQNFQRDRRTNGLKYLEQFERRFDNNEDLLIDRNIIAGAYSEAAASYFRIGGYSKAKSLLKKGLIYAPDNYELTRRLQMIK